MSPVSPAHVSTHVTVPPQRRTERATGIAEAPRNVPSSTQTISVRFRVTCKGKAVQGALLYADEVPYNQFSTPAEQPTRSRP